MNFQIEGISFGITSADETPSAKRHQQHEPSSYGLLRTQQENEKIRSEIKAQFLKEEARKFHKSMTAAYKKTVRRDARLDLEEDNRKELLKLKMKLEAEMLGRQNEQMESYREQLRLKDAKIQKLEACPGESEKDEKIKELEARLEASENGKKIKGLEALLAATMMEVDRLKTDGDSWEDMDDRRVN